MYADEILAPWVAELQRTLGPFELFDGHVHIGLNDSSGFIVTEQEALDSIDLIGERAVLLPLKEPSGYDGPNQRMAELCRESRGRHAWLARLDPAARPLRQAEDGLAAGAAGLKLHPRGEDFELDDHRLDTVWELADRERLPVLIHTGPGSEGICTQALERARAHPGARLILAHCGVGGFGSLWEKAVDFDNVFFDTSWWNVTDVIGLFECVPPGRILYASDIPFASPAQAAYLTLRCAAAAGLDPEQLAGVMGGQLRRLIAREEPLDLGPAPGPAERLSPLHERTYVTLMGALEPMLRGEDAGQGMELARTTALADEDQALDEICEAIIALLDLAQECEEPDPGRMRRRPGFDVVHAAAILARTPSVPPAVPRYSATTRNVSSAGSAAPST
jgi:predicted TIM-barrel fold metal-dependent hydrolase